MRVIIRTLVPRVHIILSGSKGSERGGGGRRVGRRGGGGEEGEGEGREKEKEYSRERPRKEATLVSERASETVKEREGERMKKREGFKILYSCRAVCDGSHHLPSQFSRF